MQTAQANLFTRPDTFFGVCEGLGEDLRIHPNLLRVALAGLLFWNPPAALAIYAGASVIVAGSRLLFPTPAAAAAPEALAAAPAAGVADAKEHERMETEMEPMPLAA